MFEGYSDSRTKMAEMSRHTVDVSGRNQTVDASGQKHTVVDASGQKHTVVDASGQKHTFDKDFADLSASFSNLFNKSNVIFIIWFLAIYLVAYFILGYFFNKGSTASTFQVVLGRMLDFIILGVLIIFIFSSYYSSTEADRENIFIYTTNGIGTYINDPFSLLFTGLFIFLFYIVIYLFRIPMSSDAKPISVSIVENMAWLLLVIIVFVDFFKYVLGISISDMLARINPWRTPVLRVVDSSLNIIPKTTGEVFNVSNNLYTYDDAQAICKSYGADMATYDQIESAYKDGAEWCNYGWSDGQMIFFPTQKSTWDKLQKTEKHKNDCGRPGVNGGYIANPYVKFGVNCFGKKPAPTADDLARMNAKQNMVYPKSPEDIALESKVDYWKQNAASLLNINSYNNKKWSSIGGTVGST